VDIPYFAVLFKGDSMATSNIQKVDQNGEFTFQNLDEGPYRLYGTKKLNVMFNRDGGKPVSVQIGKTIDVTWYVIYCPEIRLVEPVGNVIVNTLRPTFRWNHYGTESQYRVKLEGEKYYTLKTTGENYIQPDSDIEPGDYKWHVCILEGPKNISIVCSLDESFSVVIE
jgi:hypothetical protein